MRISDWSSDLCSSDLFRFQPGPNFWRRSLDFGAISDIQEISQRIRDHHAQGQKFGPGWNLKRGRGGIREVEFHAQILQMIYGSRSPEIRAPATMDALRALADAGRLDATVADDLAGSYRLYRTIEHRLQMIDDQQTHDIPKNAQDRTSTRLNSSH